MVLILIQQQFLSPLFFAFFCRRPKPPSRAFMLVLPHPCSSLFQIHIMMALFLISLDDFFFAPPFSLGCFFPCKKWKKSRAKATHKGKMVMPDVICVPNNNKAIQHPRYVLAPSPLACCFLQHHATRYKEAEFFTVCSHTPPANFRHYLIEKGFLLLCISLVVLSLFFPSRSFRPHNVSTTFCALMMFFEPFFAEAPRA